ncbi:MAG: phosphoglucosamine mutase [Clostridiales bacterium]|jgi:phosphoglucosamine mutase|nr:phosphoglucosamine mutase [Clostridiales bacterium]
MGRLFGTDGVRGVANTELTPDLAARMGAALTHILAEERGTPPKVLIGMDTRRSGHMLEAALTAGITSAGGDAVCAGIMPTPGVAYLARKYGMDAGAVISASHNPFMDNGIKFFDGGGYKMSDVTEDAVGCLVRKLETDYRTVRRPVGGQIGVRLDAEEGLSDYVDYLKSTVDGDFEDLNITLDCANGATYEAAPILFYDLKACLHVIANDPDGENINLRCGSTHIEALVEQCLENGSDIGIAFDGDGDRCLAVDEKGNAVDGDQILAILARHYKDNGMLWKNALVGTVMSNIGLSRMCEDNGISYEKTAVGDKYVLERMREQGYMLGGEQSGHIINLRHGTTGDGILTATQLIAVMKSTGKKLSELSNIMEKYPQVLVNARVSNEFKQGYLTSAEIKTAIAALEDRFKDRGSVLIRPSGTEPLIRVMIEGRDLGEITREAEALAALIEDVLC